MRSAALLRHTNSLAKDELAPLFKHLFAESSPEIKL
jgi:hypothetical protein